MYNQLQLNSTAANLVKVNLVGKFNGSKTGSTKCDAYLWAKETYLDTGMVDPGLQLCMHHSLSLSIYICIFVYVYIYIDIVLFHLMSDTQYKYSAYLCANLYFSSFLRIVFARILLFLSIAYLVYQITHLSISYIHNIILISIYLIPFAGLANASLLAYYVDYFAVTNTPSTPAVHQQQQQSTQQVHLGVRLGPHETKKMLTKTADKKMLTRNVLTPSKSRGSGAGESLSGDRLIQNQLLHNGDSIISDNGLFALTLLHNGSLAVQNRGANQTMWTSPNLRGIFCNNMIKTYEQWSQ